MSEGHFECRISGKRESASGIFLTLQIEPADFDATLATLRVGSTLMCGWAETVNADVEPIVTPQAEGGHARAEALSPARRNEIATKAAETRWNKERKPFASLPLSTQSALLCKEPGFQQYLQAKNEDEAVQAVYIRCDIHSRSELDDKSQIAPREEWLELAAGYDRHQITARYGEAVR